MSNQAQQIGQTQSAGFAARVDALLRAAQLEVAQYQGARQALVEAARELEAQLGAADRDAADGGLDDGQRVLVKRYVNRCGETVRRLAAAAQMQLFQAQGKVLAFQRTATEASRLPPESSTPSSEATEDAVEADEGPIDGANVQAAAPRAPGEHPGDPLADRRNEARVQQGTTHTVRRAKRVSTSACKPKQRRKASDAADA